MAELVQRWIIDGFKPYKFEKINIELSGSTGAGNGYLGDIIFATVHFAKNGENAVLDIVVKSGKISASLREKFPVQVAF